MIHHLSKIIVALLMGIVFFMGGTEIASAQAPGAEAKSLLDTISCGSWSECIPKLPEMIFMYLSYIIYILTAGILTLAGYLFDSVLTLSIDRSFILKPFIDNVWTIIRDFSNMLFIFILIYTGVQTILGMGNWRSTVLRVVIVALLINFSLFFTKVVIDAGNILAVGVYESIGVVKTKEIHTQGTGIQERNLSGALVNNFNPQRFLNPEVKEISVALGFMLFILGAAVNLLAAWAFLRVALLFIGRIIGFWFLMIISPFAFISTTFPKGNMFHDWLKNLLGLSFVAPVFLFFLYLIMKVLGDGGIFASVIDPDPSSFTKFSFDVFFLPVIMVLFVYMALDKSVSFSKQMAGDFGTLGARIGGAVMGVAGGLALGGAALGGRAVGGKLASKVFESGTMQRWAASDKGGLLGAAQRNLGMRGTMALDTARNASWDARNVGLVAKGIKATGVDVGKGGGKGGYIEQEKTWIKEQKKKATLMEMPDNDKVKTGIKDRYGVSDAEKVASAQKTNVDTLAGLHTDAQIAHAKAVRTAEASQTGAALKIVETKLNEQKKLVEDAKRKYDEQEKAFNSASASGSLTSEITASFENAKKTRGDAMSTLAATESAVNTARQAHQATDEYKTVASTKEATEEAAKNLERAKEIKNEADLASKRALEQAEKGIKEENERRRESYAGARWTGVANLHKPFSAKERAEVIKKIREGKTEKEKEDEDLGKTIEKLAKKVKEQDKSGEKKVEEKKEEKAH